MAWDGFPDVSYVEGQNLSLKKSMPLNEETPMGGFEALSNAQDP